jgi:hypothetical protein
MTKTIGALRQFLPSPACRRSSPIGGHLIYLMEMHRIR